MIMETRNKKQKTNDTGFLARSRSAAFTLIELLVVTAIIVVVTGTILASSSRLGGQFILDNFAYDLALTLREAQQYGISVKNFSGNFNVAYGVHFDSNNAITYELFADVDSNGKYDPGSELVQSYTITRGFKIASICATPNGVGVENCSITSLDILFKRPEPDALISASGVSCTLAPTNCQASARILMIAPRGNTRSVVMPANGQMSVQ